MTELPKAELPARAGRTLIINAEIDGLPGIDVRVDTEQILAVGPRLPRRPGEPVLDAGGAAVLPGLHDHHVHLRAAVAARRSVRLDRITGPAAFDRTVRATAAALRPGAWLRGVGWHEQTAGRLDRARLDALVPDRPARVQHRSGDLWVLNTPALEAVGGPDTDLDPVAVATGQLWRLDGWLRERIAGHADPQAFARDLGDLTAQAARAGVTGYTDATPGRDQTDVDVLSALAEAGVVGQRLLLMTPPGLRPPDSPRVRLGAHKIILDDAGLPSESDLAEAIRAGHRRQVPVAIHCLTAEQLVIATAALQLAGSGTAGSPAGDRIEHAGVVPPGYAQLLRRLGVAVVTQPGFIADRGDDYLRDVPAPEQPWLYPCGSLLRSGVAVAAATDTPFGPADPWLSIAAAVARRTAGGRILTPGERVDPVTALNLFLADPEDLGRTRRVRPGEHGDLCVLDRPLTEALAQVVRDPGHNPVRTVVLGGRLIPAEG